METAYETFEEGGSYYARGTVFVIAMVDRNTLKLIGYIEQAFLTEDEAEELINTSRTENDIAYIIQEKAFTTEIHRREE